MRKDLFGQFKDAELLWIAKIHRTREVIRSLHHPYESLDHIIYITEGTRLLSIPVYGDILVS
jgi:hypothetical protein